MNTVIFWESIPNRKSALKESEFNGRYFIKDGILFENYGTKSKPMWEEVFDADYRIIKL